MIVIELILEQMKNEKTIYLFFSKLKKINIITQNLSSNWKLIVVKKIIWLTLKLWHL